MRVRYNPKRAKEANALIEKGLTYREAGAVLSKKYKEIIRCNQVFRLVKNYRRDGDMTHIKKWG